MQSVSRRAFLVAASATGTGLMIGCALEQDRAHDGRPTSTAPSNYAPNAFIRIEPDGRVSIVIPQAEMGQGVYTSLSMLVAEELEVGLDQIQVLHAPPDERLYGNPVIGGMQVTGSSSSVRAFHEPLRHAGATARMVLMAAAARQWGVDQTSCQARRGVISHAASGRSLSYGELTDLANSVPLPTTVALKDPADWLLIGSPAKRVDTANKVNGGALYSIDVRPPGVKIATVLASPVLGGRLVSVDDGRALATPGVRQVVRLDDAVAVVADHMWAAKKGLAALVIVWDDGPNGQTGSVEVAQALAEAITQQGAVAFKRGRGAEALADVAGRHEALYEIPLLAHGTMEPMNCAVHVRSDGCEVWCCSQALNRALEAAAKTSGFSQDKVIVHNHLLGGGFGRRVETDYVEQAVLIGKHVDGPVKVVWTREEDVRHDFYRPSYRDLIRARVDGDGRPVAWTHRIVGPSLYARWAPPFFKDGIDADGVDAAVQLAYDIPDIQIEFVRHEEQVVNTGFWRGVGVTHNAFVIESFVDELATQARVDPLDFRVRMLDKSPRARAVLELAAREANWGRPPIPGRGLGIALLYSGWNTYSAQVVDVEVSESGELRVHRVVCAIDCGTTVNPDTVKAQIEGGIVFGLGAALWGEITLKKGRVQQSNFHDYRVMRMSEAPVIEVHVIRNSEHPGGVGEIGTACVAPALANAVFATTGTRHRRLPLQGRNA